MSGYRPTEYVVDFGDYRSNQFVRLNMALLEKNGAKLGEEIVRCRDCKYCEPIRSRRIGGLKCVANSESVSVEPDFFCAWAIKRTGGRVMALEWYEWECPHCKRYGQVNPSREYEDGEYWTQKCPVCGAEIVVLCSYEPAFYAYRKESWKEDGE